MQDHLLVFSSMALVKSQYHLRENAPYEVFSDEIRFFRGLAALLNEFAQIAALAVLHDQVYRCILFVYELVKAPHNILVLKFAQDIDLVDQLLLFLFIHAPVVRLLPNHLSATR